MNEMENIDHGYIQQKDDPNDPLVQLDKESALLLRRDSVQELFGGYTCEGN